MGRETGQAIIVAFHNRITTDPTMKSELGDPIRLYRVMAPEDPVMPYLVHRYEAPGVFLLTATYLLDLWDYNESPARIDSAVDRLKILLHEWQVTTGDDEIGGSVVEWFTGGYIPTDGANVWHYATQWSVRFGAMRDRTNILG